MHRRKKVDEKSCVTPAGTSIDVQNEWEENTHTLFLVVFDCGMYYNVFVC